MCAWELQRLCNILASAKSHLFVLARTGASTRMAVFILYMHLLLFYIKFQFRWNEILLWNVLVIFIRMVVALISQAAEESIRNLRVCVIVLIIISFAKLSWWSRWPYQLLFSFVWIEFIEACSHGRSHHYYAESILRQGNFTGYPCRTYETYESGACKKEKGVLMGDPTPRNARAIYFLKTSDSSPYAQERRK